MSIISDDCQCSKCVKKYYCRHYKRIVRMQVAVRKEEKYDLQMAQGMGSGRLSFKAINPEYLLRFEE